MDTPKNWQAGASDDSLTPAWRQYWRLYGAALRADDDWQAALVDRFGDSAGDKRYWIGIDEGDKPLKRLRIRYERASARMNAALRNARQGADEELAWGK